jgi:two-component system chemotaxis response regulator CheB
VTKVRVLVVDDSAFMRKVISDIITSDSQMKVVGLARNGQEAIQKVQELRPDVITLDIEMPIMDGLTALEQIMKVRPTPVVMLSSLTQAGAEATLGALQRGAVDFIAKPSGSISLDLAKLQDEIRLKIKIAAIARISRIPLPTSNTKNSLPIRDAERSRTVGTKANLMLSQSMPNFDESQVEARIQADVETKSNSAGIPFESNSDSKGSLNRLVLIGTSTGGPKALNEIVPALPLNRGMAVLIVQHMPPGFTKSLAERLDSVSALHVKEAVDGEEIVGGTAYIAPGDYHLMVRVGRAGSSPRLYVRLTREPQVSGHRPSVDVMLTSVAENFWGHMVAVILTGMGQDGTKGMKALKLKQCRTIAEDESTCVVFGMPKSAIEAGVVDRVVPLHRVAAEIKKMLY